MAWIREIRVFTRFLSPLCNECWFFAAVRCKRPRCAPASDAPLHSKDPFSQSRTGVQAKTSFKTT